MDNGLTQFLGGLGVLIAAIGIYITKRYVEAKPEDPSEPVEKAWYQDLLKRLETMEAKLEAKTMELAAERDLRLTAEWQSRDLARERDGLSGKVDDLTKRVDQLEAYLRKNDVEVPEWLRKTRPSTT